jgi:hypothetical protein
LWARKHYAAAIANLLWVQGAVKRSQHRLEQRQARNDGGPALLGVRFLVLKKK